MSYKDSCDMGADLLPGVAHGEEGEGADGRGEETGEGVVGRGEVEGVATEKCGREEDLEWAGPKGDAVREDERGEVGSGQRVGERAGEGEGGAECQGTE